MSTNYYYYSTADKAPRDMATLMPYRAEKDMRQLLAKVIRDMELSLSDEYVEMLRESVGILHSLEVSALQKELSTLRNLSKVKSVIKSGVSALPNKEKLKKQLDSRQSPELTEERQILPQWAVSNPVKWRKLLSDGDPRPIFGCDWCSPKIRAGYEGPFLVYSKLCPTCKEFEKEGYYSKMTASGSKKTFYFGDKTVWWSNSDYLLGTRIKLQISVYPWFD